MSYKQNKNLGFESGSLTLKGTEHCTITNFKGDYIKIGKLVFVNMSFAISGDGNNSDMYIDCLPYATKNIDTFNIGYANAIFTEPTNNKVFTSLFAGTWGGTTSMYLGGSLDGRNWILKGNCVTAGSININGFYKIED